MKTYEKGAIGEHRVVADLINKGYRVHKPLTDSLPYDLVVSIRGFFFKIQVKYVSQRRGYIETSPRSIKSQNNKIVNVDFDLLAIFCPDTQQCYYVWRNEFEGSIRLRMTPTKNKQSKNVKLAENYRELKINEEQ
jgi:hypothetical protein